MDSAIEWAACSGSDRGVKHISPLPVADRAVDMVLDQAPPRFALWQPHLRNVGGLDLRANFGYGSSTLARLWLDK
jgi:hypothetical protein